MRPGLSRDASRPSGVSTRLGTTRLARIPLAIPSRATCRQRAGNAAFDASYAGIPVAARRLAAEPMNTIAEPGSSTCSAAAATRKCALVLTANVSSHWAAVVPAIPRPSPIPTFSTRPSRPPSAVADSVTTDAQSSGDATSVSTTAAICPSLRTRAAVASAASASRSAQAIAAPSLAASTDMARPLPIGGSGSGDGRVPAPTTSTRRPVSRPRPGAEPVASAGSVTIAPTSARHPAAAARRTRSAGTRSACSTRTATRAPPRRRRRECGARHRRSPGPGGQSD